MMTLLEVQYGITAITDNRIEYHLQYDFRVFLQVTEDMIDEQLCLPAFHGVVTCR